MFKKLLVGNKSIWYDSELLQEDPTQIFELSFWQKNGKVIGSSQGRGTTWFVQAELMQAALRHYYRGGLFGKLVKDRYCFSSWEQTRSYQEFQLLQKLIDAGVSVPRPIAARAVKSRFTYSADLLSEKIPASRDLVSILTERSLPAEIYKKIGQEIRKMHDAQINHTDLNIHNILLDKDDKVWIIDFDKCYQQSGHEWKQGNLDRLKRSFEKEVGKRRMCWHCSDFNDLIQGLRHKG